MTKIIISIIILVTCVTAFSSPVPNTSLVDQDGTKFQLHDLKGSYVLLSFIFTRCPKKEMCPLTIQLSKQAQREWAEKYPKKKIVSLAITLDPEFDTPEVLKNYGKGFNINSKSFRLATGNPQSIEDFASEFNVVAFPSEGTLSHNLKTILISPEMNELKQFKDNEWAPKDVLTSLPKVTGE